MHDDPRTPDDVDPDEFELADRLRAMRPVPGAGFRGALGRYLAERDPGWGSRPQRLHALVGVYVGAGVALIAAGMLVAL
jgi:hypothetical protein